MDSTSVETNSINDLTFEEGIARLDEIVNSMESGEIELDSLVSRYENGIKLLKHCRAIIDNAQLIVNSINDSHSSTSSSESND
tara:strand:- start:150 stop:398 length:249 start_codon:yes stop_codon:yes gene_type:complete